jgi:hypothetical protein
MIDETKWIIRDRPQARCASLRVQIGILEERPFLLPLHEGRQMVGHAASPSDNVTTFHLLGYGATLAKAQARARQAAQKGARP